MLYRNISNILEQQFSDFIKESKLNYKLINDVLYIYNSCMALEIYALEDEDIAHIELYDLKKRRWRMELNGIISEYLEKDTILQIYKKNERFDTNEAIASIKKYFYSDLEILQLYFQDILSCDFTKYQKLFVPASPQQIAKLKKYKIAS